MFLFIKRLKNSRGAVAVETALIMLFVIVPLLLGMLEFGWLFNGWITITSAAREGARVAVLAEDNNADVISRINEHISGSTVKSAVPAIDRTKADSVEVIVVGKIMPVINIFVKGDEITGLVDVSGRAVMRKEY